MLFDLFRPAWKSKRKSRRLKALRGQQLELEQIQTLAQYDPESEVRKEAIAQLKEDTQLYRLWLSERQPEIQSFIMDLLAERLNQELSPLARLKRLCESVNMRSFPLSELIARITCEASKKYLFGQIISLQELWKMASERGEFQLDALRKFDDQEALENLHKSLRRGNKGAAHAVKIRLDEIAETQARNARKSALIERYKYLAEATPLKPVNLLSRLNEEWEKEGFEDSSERQKWIKEYQDRFQRESRQASPSSPLLNAEESIDEKTDVSDAIAEEEIQLEVETEESEKNLG